MRLVLKLSVMWIAAVLLGLCISGLVSSQSVELHRFVSSDGADVPSGRLILRVSSDGTQAKQENKPEVEEDDPMPEPGEEVPGEPIVPPTFFDEVVRERAVFVLDISGSMDNAIASANEDADGNAMGSPTRLDKLKTELINMLEAMPDGYEFDIVCFPSPAGSSKPPMFWKKALVEINAGTRTAAINWINALKADGGTPVDIALTHTTLTYPHEIDQLFCLCDGGMGSHYPVHFIGQFQPFADAGCTFVGVHVGATGADDMIKLTTSVGGQYKHVD